MKLTFKVYAGDFHHIDFQNVMMLDEIDLEAVAEENNVGQIKASLNKKINFAPLSSVHVGDMQVYYFGKLIQNHEEIGSRVPNDEDTLTLVVNADVCYDKRKSLKNATTLEEIFSEIKQIYEGNKILKSEIDSANKVRELDYYGNYEVNIDTYVPSLAIAEEPVTVDAKSIIMDYKCSEAKTEAAGGAGAGAPTSLIEVTDLFNDKIPFKDFSAYAHLHELNERMFPVVEKYVAFFEPENKKIVKILLEYLENYFIINRHLKALKRKLLDHESKLVRLREIESSINVLFKQLLDEGVRFSPRPFKSSTILDCASERTLLSYLPPDVAARKPTLLYRSSLHGKSESTFFNNCNGQGGGVVIFKSTAGYVFGGYTSAGWAAYNNYRGDSLAFLFSLKNPHGNSYKFVGNGNIGTYAIYGYQSQGPRFGGGHDIGAQSFSSSVSFNLNHTYTDSSGLGTNVFVGGSSCQIDDMEVWKL